MKIQKLIILPALLVFLVLSGFNYYLQILPSEERRVPDFSGLSIAVPGEVFLVQGQTQKLVVEGTERVLDNLITEVRGGQLSIRMPNRWNFRRNDRLKVYVTMPEIKNLTLSGSARLNAESPVRAGNISITISGSGRVDIDDFAATDLSVTISGSGRINLGGTQNLEKSKIVISGSGRMESGSLPAENIDVNVSGSGTCRVHATSGLNVRISGSGRVIYTGNPLIDARISGSGRVVNAN